MNASVLGITVAPDQQLQYSDEESILDWSRVNSWSLYCKDVVFVQSDK